jgi:hypothetical protein
VAAGLPGSAHRGRRGGEESAIGAFANQPTGREGAADPVLPPGIVAHFTRPLEVLLR